MRSQVGTCIAFFKYSGGCRYVSDRKGIPHSHFNSSMCLRIAAGWREAKPTRHVLYELKVEEEEEVKWHSRRGPLLLYCCMHF